MESLKILVWTDKLTMYNAKLDYQHQTLFKYINEIIEVEQITPRSKQFAEILSKITDYGLEHFKEEERLMLDFGFPHDLLQDHVQQHRDYTYQVAMFNTRFYLPNSSNPADVISFLRDWWYKHILRSDMRFSQYVRKQLSS